MKKNAYFGHLKTILNHKKVVLKECAACGILWQGIIHDLSKFSIVEFASSARYFSGTRSPIEAEKEAIGYSTAWLHHKGHNKHHWEYWTDFDSEGNIVAYDIPDRYVIEMVCDWIGAGKVYSKDKWTQHTPLEYYNKVRAGRHFSQNTEKLLLKLLNIIDKSGLDSFHEYCRNYLKHRL